MSASKSESLPLCTDEDVIHCRQIVRKWMVEQGFKLIAQTKMVTAVSELARNTVIHGKGGVALLEFLSENNEFRGIRVTCEDHGPGIPDIEQALKGGFSTGDGLGLGLSGSKRLVDEFQLCSEPGKGTRVTITMWK